MILFVNVTFASGVPDGDFDSLALVGDSQCAQTQEAYDPASRYRLGEPTHTVSQSAV
jgi:hypothetical protein